MNKSLIERLPVDSVLTYIPSQSDKTGKYFKEFRNWFGYYGYKNFQYFDLDEDYREDKLDEVRKSDSIYLSGGNTPHFLYNIKKRRFDRILREHISSGGILIGLSAGSYIMTPTILYTVEYHKQLGNFDVLNIDRLSEFDALGFVDFEVVPHFDHVAKRKLARKYKKRIKNKLYGMYDGSGIIIDGTEVQFIGRVVEV
jgi:dipeptidase E